MATDHAEARYVPGTRCKNAPASHAGGEEIGHLADGLIGGQRKRAEDAEPAVASWLAEGNEDLVEQAVAAPASALFRRGRFISGGRKVGEGGIVIPKAGFVISQPTRIARQTVGLVTDFTNRKYRSIHGHIRAVVLVISNGGIAIVNGAHNVSALSRPDLKKYPPGRVWISGHAWSVEKNAHRITTKTVLHEQVIINR